MYFTFGWYDLIQASQLDEAQTSEALATPISEVATTTNKPIISAVFLLNQLLPMLRLTTTGEVEFDCGLYHCFYDVLW